jgi:hypothetical protein
MKIAVVDAETDPFHYGRVPEPFIWGFFDGDQFLTWDNAEGMVEWLAAQENLIVYAHNGGRFDWHYVRHLIPVGTEVMLINGRIAKFQIGGCEFRDSLNLIPVQLAAYEKEIIDYRIFEAKVRHKPANWSRIVAYLESDCRNLFALVSAFISLHGEHLTQASASLAAWSEISGRKPPKSSQRFFESLSPYYRGGRVEARRVGDLCEDFTVYDINSAYPRAMLEHHPISTTYQMVASRGPRDKGLRLLDAPPQSFYSVMAIAGGSAACGEVVNGEMRVLYPADRTVRRYDLTGWELQAGIDTGALEVERVICRIDFEESISFRDYIEHWWRVRKEAQEAGDEVKRLFAKLFMNSLYGKLASDPRTYCRAQVATLADALAGLEDGEPPGIRDDKGRFWRFSGRFAPDRALVQRKLDRHEMRFYNVATGASVTGYVRAMLWRAIHACGPENVIYCDTDSIAVLGADHDIDIGPELGQWKNEGAFDRAVIVRRKTYAFHMAGKSNASQNWKIAAKGLPGSTNYRDMLRALNGEEVVKRSSRPIYSVSSGIKFQSRTLRSEKV